MTESRADFLYRHNLTLTNETAEHLTLLGRCAEFVPEEIRKEIMARLRKFCDRKSPAHSDAYFVTEPSGAFTLKRIQ